MQRFLVLGILWTAVVRVLAADAPSAEYQWHQGRGPLANGTALHADPPVRWSETTNVKWKVPVPGEGSSTPIVWGDQVLLLAAIRTDRTVESLPKPEQEPPGGYKTERPKNFYKFEVLSFHRETGKLCWRQTAVETVPHEGRHDTNTYASGSPSTDGRRLYASFGSQGVFCFDMQGKLLWQRDLGRMVTRFGWGEGASPTLYGDSLIVNWDHEGQSFVAVLDAQTGATRWKADRNEVSSWATPLVVPREGGTQVVINATRRAAAYDLATGKVLWECGGQTTNVVPSPVVFDDLAIVMSGFQGTAAFAIPLGSRGDVTGTNQVAWQYRTATPYVPSPLLVGDRLYFTKGNSAVLTCLNAKTGKPLMEAKRLPGLKNMYGSPVAANGRIYLASREGVALVIKQQPELEILATNQLDDGFDASPAVVGRQLFLRGKSHLYCIAEK